jgi:hypothetical protein
LLHPELRLSPAPFALLCKANPEAVLELSASGHGGWKGLGKLLSRQQSQQRLSRPQP